MRVHDFSTGSGTRDHFLSEGGSDMVVMELTAHPGADTLREFSQGRLPADEAAVVEEHLGSCDSCCHLLEDTPNDSFVGRLRAARELPCGDTHMNLAGLTLDEDPG